MSGQSFSQDVIAGTQLVTPSIHSPNFITGVSGWTINLDGSAEFNNLTIRGTFTGTDFIINSSGAFFYSGTPANGNLIASITSANGTDGFGNSYIAGITSYAGATYASLDGGLLAMQGANGQFQQAQIAAGGSGSSFMSSGLQNNTDIGSEVLLFSADANDTVNSLVTLSAAIVQVLNALTVGTTMTVTGDAQLNSTAEVSGTLTVGNGSTSSLVFNPKIATPTNFPTSGKTLAQTQACLDALITSFRNRGMVN